MIEHPKRQRCARASFIITVNINPITGRGIRSLWGWPLDQIWFNVWISVKDISVYLMALSDHFPKSLLLPKVEHHRMVLEILLAFYDLSIPFQHSLLHVGYEVFQRVCFLPESVSRCFIGEAADIRDDEDRSVVSHASHTYTHRKNVPFFHITFYID